MQRLPMPLSYSALSALALLLAGPAAAADADDCAGDKPAVSIPACSRIIGGYYGSR